MQSKAKVKDEIMNIGRVAELSGVQVETIRFYERAGVLPQPKRKPSGYRQFDMSTVDRIRFIKNMQEMGFSLAESGELASLKGLPGAIERVKQRIRDLEELQRELKRRSRS